MAKESRPVFGSSMSADAGVWAVVFELVRALRGVLKAQKTNDPTLTNAAKAAAETVLAKFPDDEQL